ncbi:hypothetical protein V2J09_020216 [Rumex salicifolius]
MEQKHFLMSALGVGIGVGVGLGFASGQAVGKWKGSGAPTTAIIAEKMEQEMLNLVIDGREAKVTFDEFPYYLSEQTRVLLTSAAWFYLKKGDFSKYTRNLAPASRAILLSGPAELYQQMLAKALAHYFEAKLLLFDVNEFSLRIQSKYGSDHKESYVPLMKKQKRLVFLAFIASLVMKVEAHYVANPVDWIWSQGSLKRTCSWPFDEKLLIQSLYKVLVAISKTDPIILYLRDVDKLLSKSQRVYNLFQKMLSKLSGSVLILGARMTDVDFDYEEEDEKLSYIFPYSIDVKPPEDETHLVSWKSQLEEDMKMIQNQDNRNHIIEVLASNDVECDDLGSVCVSDTSILSNYIEEIVVSAISYHLMNKKHEYRNGKLILSPESLAHGLSIFQEGKTTHKDALKLEAHAEPAKEPCKQGSIEPKPESKTENVTPEKKSEATTASSTVKDGGSSDPPPPKVTDVPPDNEFERRIRPEVIPANEISVKFSDIGALEDIKDTLQEIVMLPLRRPDLFKGGLLKPCRGILLFGPPGTGKTMLAKAIAKEAGASFINVSMSTITSKWFGEDEKNVRALFSLASKVSPTIIFVDEVDSMLGQRSRAGEHEAMRKIKNEFMSHWDGLMTKPGERILVLAATNRPFDLDEAIIRRFERRIMVGLPSVENREMILKTLLAKEKAEIGLDFKEIARMTEGYSGSDLKNLCTTAAYRPVRELIQQERLKDMEEKDITEKSQISEDDYHKEGKEDREINLRPLNMEDFKEAKNQLCVWRNDNERAEGVERSLWRRWVQEEGTIDNYVVCQNLKGLDSIIQFVMVNLPTVISVFSSTNCCTTVQASSFKKLYAYISANTLATM